VSETRSRPNRLVVGAWIFILVAIGSFQLFRGAIVDALVFLVIAAALLLDAFGTLRSIETRRRSVNRWFVHRWFVIVAIVVSAIVLIVAPRHGIADGVLVVVIGLLALGYAWPDPAVRPPAAQAPVTGVAFARSVWLWASVGIVACLWELAMYLLGNFLPGGRASHPALSDVLDPAVDTLVGRILFTAAWLLGGLALLRRAARR
jgi:hypothetical protein